MKKGLAISALVSVLCPYATMSGQSAVDAFKLSQSELRGTARFMSMAGAFGALGGDLSTLTQNPAGIGVYRGSEIGVTLDVNFQNAGFKTPGYNRTTNNTFAACDNFGYVGSASTGSELMPFFSWGATYQRAVSFDRTYDGFFPSIGTSLSNYVADFTSANDNTGFAGYSPASLAGTNHYDPFVDSDVPWLSALAYNTYMINPTMPDGRDYRGLYGDGSAGNAYMRIHERGYVDQYSLNLGGNFLNTVYWGLGVGIMDINYTVSASYDEEITDAVIANADADGVQRGDAYWQMNNYQSVSGSGFNLKFGLIVKPINEVRIGFAVHSPTWYNLRYASDADVMYEYNGVEADGSRYAYVGGPDNNDFSYTGTGYWDAKLHTPWRMIVSAAGVIGGRGIISLDYEYEAYQSMRVGDDYGTFDDVTMDVKQYYRGTSTLRLGAEYRLTPSFSLRAGYSYKTSPTKASAYDGNDYIYTSGTNPAYEFDNTIQHITCGLGYRYRGFYADLAYVHKYRQSKWSAFSGANNPTSNGVWTIADAPTAELTSHDNHLVISVGYKF